MCIRQYLPALSVPKRLLFFLCKPIINEINSVLAKHYGFIDEELDFIINYDIKYRMGQDMEENGDS